VHKVDDVFVIIDGSTRKPCLHPLKTALEQNKTVGLTPHCILIRRDGAEFAIEDSAAPIHYLGLELTESVLMQHAEFTVPVLKKLKAMGICLAIDDFGTGYSSLSYLRQFPIDTLKVGQSFVKGINADRDDATIINAVINMWSNLKYRVIAEGVETVEHVAFLQAHGCDEGQGYYFSRPVPAFQFAKLLEAEPRLDCRTKGSTAQNIPSQNESTSMMPCSRRAVMFSESATSHSEDCFCRHRRAL
jgi:hypothetical protein